MFLRTLRRACNYTKAKMKTYTCRYTKRRPFSPSFYIKNYELIPMATICILDGCMVAFCAIRTFLNTDIKYSNHIKTRGEDIELLKEPRCLKFYCPTQEFESNMDLYNLYQEMIEAQKCEDEPDTCERKEGGGWIISADKEKKETPPEGEEPEPPEKKLTDAQRKEQERKEKERKELERKELEQKEKGQKEMEQKEKGRKEMEQNEKERKEKERKEMEQKEKERKEKERKAMEQKEKERKEKERKEMEQKEKERKAKESAAKKKPETQQKEPEPKPKSKRDVSKESLSGSIGGSLSLEQIMKRLVIKEHGIESPELLFGATINTAHHRKAYLDPNGIQTIVTSAETSYDKGHKVVEEETTKIDTSRTNRKQDTMHQKVIKIIHPSGKSDIALKKFYLEKGGKLSEIKEAHWMSAFPATINIEKIKPDTFQKMTTYVQMQKKQENDKITEIETTTKEFPTGAKKIKEKIKISYISGKSPAKTEEKYYLVMGGKRTTIGVNEWEEVDIRPHISYSPTRTSTTVQTENETDTNGNKKTTTITTKTLANGDQIITTDIIMRDKNGKPKGEKHETHKVPKGGKRRLEITGFF